LRSNNFLHFFTTEFHFTIIVHLSI